MVKRVNLSACNGGKSVFETWMKPKFIKVHFMGHSKNGVKHCDINEWKRSI